MHRKWKTNILIWRTISAFRLKYEAKIKTKFEIKQNLNLINIHKLKKVKMAKNKQIK